MASGDIQNPIQISIDSSGSAKGTLLKGLVYVILPVVLLSGIGYLIYNSIATRQLDLNFLHGRNDSDKYQNDKVKIQIEIKDLKTDVKENADRKNFEDVKQMVIQKYGNVK